MLEYKEITLHDTDATSTINAFAKFGWQLNTTNTIGYTDHIVNGVGFGGTYEEYHTNVHSSETKLTFQRETTMPHYEELKKLFLSYEKAMYSVPTSPKKPSKNFLFYLCMFGTLAGLVILGLFGIEFLGNLRWGFTFFTTLMFFLTILGLGLIVLCVWGIVKIVKKYNSKAKETNDIMISRTKDLKDCLNKAEAIISLPEVKKYLSNPGSDHSPNQKSAEQVSSADEIRKFKKLLDDGIITKEEFEKKKKELLGI